MPHCMASMPAVAMAKGLKNILVADDEKNTREALEAIFAGRGYGVTIASDGREALDLLAGRGFDLIITDLEMSGMNGLVFLKELQRRGITTKVIVISAYRKSETYRQVEKASVYRFIDKPFRKGDILGIVEEALME